MVLWCAMVKTIGGGGLRGPPVVFRQNERPWLLGLKSHLFSLSVPTNLVRRFTYFLAASQAPTWISGFTGLL